MFTVVVCIVAFMVGAMFGVFIAAILAAGRDDRD